MSSRVLFGSAVGRTEKVVILAVILSLTREPMDQGAQKTELRPNSYTEIWPKFDIFRVPKFLEDNGYIHVVFLATTCPGAHRSPDVGYHTSSVIVLDGTASTGGEAKRPHAVEGV